MSPTHPHHAKETCAFCGCFLRWSAKLENLERQSGNGFRIAKLSMCEGLTSWERDFLKSLQAQKKLSPKQQAVLDKLCAKYLEA